MYNTFIHYRLDWLQKEMARSTLLRNNLDNLTISFAKTCFVLNTIPCVLMAPYACYYWTQKYLFLSIWSPIMSPKTLNGICCRKIRLMLLQGCEIPDEKRTHDSCQFPAMPRTSRTPEYMKNFKNNNSNNFMGTTQILNITQMAGMC